MRKGRFNLLTFRLQKNEFEKGNLKVTGKLKKNKKFFIFFCIVNALIIRDLTNLILHNKQFCLLIEFLF